MASRKKTNVAVVESAPPPPDPKQRAKWCAVLVCEFIHATADILMYQNRERSDGLCEYKTPNGNDFKPWMYVRTTAEDGIEYGVKLDQHDVRCLRIISEPVMKVAERSWHWDFEAVKGMSDDAAVMYEASHIAMRLTAHFLRMRMLCAAARRETSRIKSEVDLWVKRAIETANEQ